MKTTLNIIAHYGVQEEEFGKLLEYVGKTKSDVTPVSMADIYKSNGIEYSMHCLRCFEYRDYCLFLGEALELIFPEADEDAKYTIQAIKDYYYGIITWDTLFEAREMLITSEIYHYYRTIQNCASRNYAPYSFDCYYRHLDEEKKKQIEVLFVEHFVEEK